MNNISINTYPVNTPVVAQRGKPKNINNNYYCPGKIFNIKNNLFLVKYPDGIIQVLPRKYININDPNDIEERNKYWYQMNLIFKKGRKVLANIDPNSINSSYQYGYIKEYNINFDTCNILFNNYGLINNIPTNYIVTSCDNRFNIGIIDPFKLYQEEEEDPNANIDLNKFCNKYPNIKNTSDDIDENNNLNNLSSEELELSSDQQEEIDNFKKIVKLIVSIIFSISIFICLYISIKSLFFENEKLIRFNFKIEDINILLKIFWILLICFSLGPYYLLFFIIKEFLSIFCFTKESFNFKEYLNGNKYPNLTIFNTDLISFKFYLVILILVYITKIILILKSLKSKYSYYLNSSDTVNVQSVKLPPSLNLNSVPSVDNNQLNSIQKEASLNNITNQVNSQTKNLIESENLNIFSENTKE